MRTGRTYQGFRVDLASALELALALEARTLDEGAAKASDCIQSMIRELDWHRSAQPVTGEKKR